ncbi:DUF6030 family protein [Chenggangzhangella methanolivorans]|uniref:DUF6030 family protein n=1 Tax=Chenggangzhangella methanolivorans TaxID=1437009 RepID=A0A9E6RCU6_9HYPH|nr:DUF6030 family protein [Chenggangzhangella methanolivorans]QZO01485.1 DUF6030 family protein [Chenggangzhangella methanolivorans]
MTPLRLTKAQLISAALAAVLLVAGVAATVAVRPDWLAGSKGLLAKMRGAGLKPLPKPGPPPAPDPLHFLSDNLVAWLVAPRPDAPSPFVRLTHVEPERFCTALAKSGLRNAEFRMSEPPLRGWTCVTDLVKPIEGDEYVVSSLFVAARGLESDRIDNIRMKLNLLDEATSPVARAIARDTLFQICRSLGFEPPREVVAQLDELKEGRIFEGGVSWDLRREFGPQARYNLIAIFPRTLTAGGEDRFVTDIRRKPVAR